MRFPFPLALCALASACAQSDSIDASGAVYKGVSPTASITLTGTEPFWALEIGPEDAGRHSARFTDTSDVDGAQFSVTRFAGNNGLGFSGEMADKPVHIALTPGECSDGMSDRGYPFAATVSLGDALLLGCAYTSDTPFTGPDTP